MQQFDMRKFAELNSATKYPSIETYHVLGEKGALTEDLGPFAVIDPHASVYLTEKVDGTNARIVLRSGGDYFIGSREELLYARGDRVQSPTLGIVQELLPVAEYFAEKAERGQYDVYGIEVLYFEVYGHKVGAQAKQYSTLGNVGHRLFDHAFIGWAILDWPREDISSWREHGGQTFQEVEQLRGFAEEHDLESVPYRTMELGKNLPLTVEETYGYLSTSFTESLAVLDEGGQGRSEGIVLRTNDRSKIAKARFQDYERTLKRRK